MSVDSLARANASLRRGGTRGLAVILPFVVVFLLYWASRGFRAFALENITHRPIGGWLALALVLALFAYLVREARRTSRTLLTAAGLDRGDSAGPINWADITVAEYARHWLRLQDRAGRRVAFSLMFASSSNAVLEAVQDHLPPGVRLRVY